MCHLIFASKAGENLFKMRERPSINFQMCSFPLYIHYVYSKFFVYLFDSYLYHLVENEDYSNEIDDSN